MEIYQVCNIGMMGHISDDLYFEDIDMANKEFAKRIIKAKKSESYATDDDCAEHNMMKKNGDLELCLNGNKKSFHYCYWYRCNHEVEEYDVAMEEVQLNKIHIIQKFQKPTKD